MGGSGCAVDDSQVFFSLSKTVVLVGKTGNGKSATGNSIIGEKVFDSMLSSGGVTTTCQLHSTVLEDGRILNVIDTPGLFDSEVEPESIGKEIAKCINMAKDGIHAVLVVLSIRSRFSREESEAIESLREFFGGKFGDYMIVVFAGGDLLGKDDSLNSYLGRKVPLPLAKLLTMCGNRCVLFDNTTDDKLKKSEQRKELIYLVDTVVENNGGKPYTNDLFIELKMGELNVAHQPSQFEEKFDKYEDHLKRFTNMVELRLLETTLRLEKQLAEERAARILAEADAKAAQQKSHEEMFKLREDLERARREADEERNRQRILAEAEAKAAQMKTTEEMIKLREDLERTRREAEEEKQRHREAEEEEKNRRKKEEDELRNRRYCAIM